MLIWFVDKAAYSISIQCWESKDDIGISLVHKWRVYLFEFSGCCCSVGTWDKRRLLLHRNNYAIWCFKFLQVCVVSICCWHCSLPLLPSSLMFVYKRNSVSSHHFLIHFFFRTAEISPEKVSLYVFKVYCVIVSRLLILLAFVLNACTQR